MNRPAPGTVGEQAEKLAERHLREHGLRLIARNYRCRAGEIDLVLREGETLAFVEVRYRRGGGFANPAESITKAKQRRIRLVAEHFLQRHTKLEFQYCRFDVVSIVGDSAHMQVEWIRDAFE